MQSADQDSVRLVVMGDCHIYQQKVPWHSVFSKRIIAHLNAKWNKRRQFDKSLLSRVAAAVAQVNPDHLLMSGDFTGTALPDEFDEFQRQFVSEYQKNSAKKRSIFAVPGNHDRYTFASKRRSTYEQCTSFTHSTSFPSLIDLAANWRLLSMDSAVPRLFSSRGLVGPAQLAAAKLLLKDVPQTCGVVVLCHYPFVVPPEIHWPRHHRLADMAAVQRLIEGLAPRPVIYIHGHIHKPWHYQPTDTTLSHVHMLNAGSPTQVTNNNPVGQGFWQINLPPDASSDIEFVHHELKSSH